MIYTGSKIKRRQIQMAVMTVLTLIIGIVSFIDSCWISTMTGRIGQFFYWGFFKIFNGLESAHTPAQIYESIALNEVFCSINPALTLELVIMLIFFVAVASPISMLIEYGALRLYTHFTAVHGVLFGLSVAEWIALPVLLMQFFRNSPIQLGLTGTSLNVVLHLWFYMTLLTYLAIGYIYDVTGRYEIYELVHGKLKAIWDVCFKVWKGIAVVSVFIATIGISLIVAIIAGSTRVTYRDYDSFW